MQNYLCQCFITIICVSSLPMNSQEMRKVNLLYEAVPLETRMKNKDGYNMGPLSTYLCKNMEACGCGEVFLVMFVKMGTDSPGLQSTESIKR